MDSISTNNLNSGLYLISNKSTGKVYIGSSSNLRKRRLTHMRQLRNGNHHNVYLQRAFNKYGESDFHFCVLLYIRKEELFNSERLWIDCLKEVGYPLYNIGSVSGGDNLTNHPDKENILARYSEIAKYNMSLLSEEERKEKYGNPGEQNPNWKGGVYERKSTCECGNRKAYSADNCMTCTDKSGENNSFYGRHHTDQTKELIAKKNKGRLPPNCRAVIAQGKEYVSATEAAKVLGVVTATILNRCNNENKEDYYFKNSEEN